MANRLVNAECNIANRLSDLNDDDLASLDEGMAISFQEHFAYQNAQARAHAMGRITVDEARYIYVALSEVYSESNGGWKDGTPTARKVAITKAMAELI